jgi:hypothetical protein
VNAAYVGLIGALMVLLILCEFAASAWDYFWEYLR